MYIVQCRYIVFLSLSLTFSQLSHYYLCRTIGCCRCFYLYDINTHPPPPPPSNACKPRGRRWHAIINNTALTYNQLHIDQQHIISYYSHSLQLSSMNEPGKEREKELIHCFNNNNDFFVVVVNNFACAFICVTGFFPVARSGHSPHWILQ